MDDMDFTDLNSDRSWTHGLGRNWWLCIMV